MYQICKYIVFVWTWLKFAYIFARKKELVWGHSAFLPMSARASSAVDLDNSPPKKKPKKSKQRVTCNEGQDSSQNKRPNATQVNDCLDAPCRSGRTGAGSGGQITQLERIGDALDGQTRQS